MIGWSLGGIYARTLARDTPYAVRQIITLGSPIRLAHESQSRAGRAFDRAGVAPGFDWIVVTQAELLPCKHS